MARNLVRAGNDVTVWNRSIEKAQSLATEVGCDVAETPASLVGATEVVVTMLADDPSSEAVHLGAHGLFAGQGAQIFVEMGTMSPDHIAMLVAAAPEGVTVIDAPVSGATKAAAEAKLLIMAGCRQGDATPIIPVFDALGHKTMFLGTVGSGAVMKLAVNSLLHGINQTFAEAMILAEATGIPPETAFEVIENSAACAPMLKYRRPLYLNEADHDVTFTVALARKDIEVTAALAATYGTAMPQGHTTLAKLIEADAAGYGARDMAAMLSFMRKDKP
jgi:3-hydroxyisobutyrate dehydrogenase